MCRLYLFNLEEFITFKAIQKKNDYEYSITFPIDGKIAQLKEHIHTLTGIIIFILPCYILVTYWCCCFVNTHTYTLHIETV